MNFQHAIVILGRAEGPDPESVYTNDDMSFGFAP
jgi:hypothetical protein